MIKGNNSTYHEPSFQQDLFICDASTKWIVSHINRPYVCARNRIGLDYFLNIPSSRLDWMHPKNPWLEKCLTVNITQERNPQMKFQVWNPQTHSRLKGCVCYILLVYFLCLKENTCKSRKNVFISPRKLFSFLR